jgi:hypothetical protein
VNRAAGLVRAPTGRRDQPTGAERIMFNHSGRE